MYGPLGQAACACIFLKVLDPASPHLKCLTHLRGVPLATKMAQWGLMEAWGVDVRGKEQRALEANTLEASLDCPLGVRVQNNQPHTRNTGSQLCGNLDITNETP